MISEGDDIVDKTSPGLKGNTFDISKDMSTNNVKVPPSNNNVKINPTKQQSSNQVPHAI
jgi:hypothetical protein